MCFLGVTWGSRRSHGFYSTLQPAERLRNLGGVGGLDAAPRVRLSASWGREQNTEGKKKNKNRRGRRGESTKRWVWVWLHDECGTLLGATAALISRIIRGDQQTNKQTNIFRTRVSVCEGHTSCESWNIPAAHVPKTYLHDEENRVWRFLEEKKKTTGISYSRYCSYSAAAGGRE